MLSCVMKRSQTLGYSKRGSNRVVGGVDLCESAHTIPLSVWTAQPAMVRYLLTYPVTTPFSTRYAPGLQKQGWGAGGMGLCIFPTWSPQRWRPVCWPCGQIYLSSSGEHKLHRFQKWTLATCARCRESRDKPMPAHLSQAVVWPSHTLTLTHTPMIRLLQGINLSFWFSFCSSYPLYYILFPQTAPLIIHKKLLLLVHCPGQVQKSLLERASKATCLSATE